MENSSSRRTFLGITIPTIGALGLEPKPSHARAATAGAGEMVAKAVDFLRSRQDHDGGWSGDRKEPGITALVTTAILRSGRVTPHEAFIAKALAFLERLLGAEGGLDQASHATYATSIALLAFREANQGDRFGRIIRGAHEFLKLKQWDESSGRGRSDAFYGGAGYGGKNSRPDLSNTAFMIEALRESGLPPDDPSLQKALVFISRCQNLDSEFNDQPWAGKVNDGGFIYTAANGGTSVAGKTEEGGLRSYASMTYAGLKSMIHAGLTPDDPRVKAATAYLRRHYTFQENPGLGQRGLYYYYHTAARALSVIGEPTFADADGHPHDWRADLISALAERQSPQGYWVNSVDGFMEGDANLVTAYGLLALAAIGTPH